MLQTKIKVPVERNRNLEGKAETSLEARSSARKPGHVPRREQLGVRGTKVPEQELRTSERAPERRIRKGAETCSTACTVHLPSWRYFRLIPTNLQQQYKLGTCCCSPLEIMLRSER